MNSVGSSGHTVSRNLCLPPVRTGASISNGVFSSPQRASDSVSESATSGWVYSVEARPDVLRQLAEIRVCASLAMGIAKTEGEARAIGIVPFIALVSPPAAAPTSTGHSLSQEDIDLAARVISNSQPHRALPLTIALCTEVAARIGGTVVASVLPPSTVAKGRLRLGMPSGVLTIEAEMAQAKDGTWDALSGSFYRTARLLFSGQVHVLAP